MAVALSKASSRPAAGPITVSNEMRRTLSGSRPAMAPGQRYVRGIFSGGTFCFEAQLVHARGGHPRLLQHADGRQPRCSTTSGRARSTRSSTWATTSSRRAARTR